MWPFGDKDDEGSDAPASANEIPCKLDSTEIDNGCSIQTITVKINGELKTLSGDDIKELLTRKLPEPIDNKKSTTETESENKDCAEDEIQPDAKPTPVSAAIEIPTPKEDSFQCRDVSLSPVMRMMPSAELRKVLDGEISVEWAFGYDAGSDESRVAIVDNAKCPEKVWFVGDVHGDVLALKDCVAYIDAMCNDATIVFLGDIVDRHEYHLESVSYLMALAVDRPGRILWIAGNHDDALQYDSEKNLFISKAEPAEFKDYLNAHPEFSDLGVSFISFVKKLPRALVLRKNERGLLAVHGGFPHDGFDGEARPDARQEKIESVKDLGKDSVQSDFMWARIEDKRRSRFAGGKRDHGLGYENFKKIRVELQAALGVTIDKVVFGHQHPSKGYEYFKSYEENADAQVVCVQSQYLDAPGMASKEIHTRPCVAQYGPNDSLTVFRLRRSDEAIKHYYEALAPKERLCPEAQDDQQNSSRHPSATDNPHLNTGE